MSAKIIDLSGKKFGFLTVINKYECRKSGSSTKAFWKCKCKCGNEHWVRASSLINGSATKSCGCERSFNKRKLGKIKDRIGYIFSFLKVIGPSKRVKSGKSYVTKWKCKCICGREVWIQPSSFNRVKSCGCKTKELQSLAKRKPFNAASINSIYGQYRCRASKKKMDFEFTKDDFFKMSQCNCHYCGNKPSNICHNPNRCGDFVYNGLDRVDNNKGYTPKNCVPCCKICNRAKDVMKKEEFKKWIAIAYNTLFLK